MKREEMGRRACERTGRKIGLVPGLKQGLNLKQGNWKAWFESVS